MSKMAAVESTNATRPSFGHGGGDTTYTKIFVGGLAWETKRDTLKRYFDQFGEIIEAVVINDKITGKSKGYGFVTFTEADSAIRACYNPFPVIDGRRANCNLAAFGIQKNRPTSASQHHEMGKFSSPPPRPPVMPPSSTTGTPALYRQPVPQYAFPYSGFGYPGYPHNIYPLNYYYNVYGGQQFPSHYTTGSTGSPGVYLSYYPMYPQYPKYRAFGTPPPAASPSSVASTGGAAAVEEVTGKQAAAASAQSDDQIHGSNFDLQFRN